MFRADVLARHKFHAVEAHAIGRAHNIAELNERVSPIAREQDKITIIGEPLTAQQVGGLFVLFAVLANKSVLAAFGHANALGDTALKVQVYEVVGVNVVEHGTLRIIHIYGHLPRLTPHAHILFCERVGLLHELRGEAHALLGARELSQTLHVVAAVNLSARHGGVCRF